MSTLRRVHGRTGHRLSADGILETRRWYRQVRRRLERDADDLRLLIARVGDLLETLPKRTRRR